MVDVAAHEAVFADLRENLAAFLRADTLNPAASAPGEDDGAFLHPEAAPRPGPACVVGVIDDAIPLALERLAVRGSDGALRSRIASAWMMGAPAGPGEVRFGREWRGPAIDALLNGRRVPGAGIDEEAVYRGAGLWRAARGPLHAGGRRAAHGAAVADLAAGADPDDRAARQRPIVAACLPPEVTRDTSGTFAAWFVLLGTLHVLDRARRLAAALGRPPLPVVVNLSYGVTAGAKDGSGLVEGFQRLVAERGVAGVGPVRFVLPMGNHRQGRLRARLTDGATLRWQVPPDDATPSFVELRGPPLGAPPDPMTFALAPPGATPFETRLPHGTASELTLGGTHAARAYSGLARTPDGRFREVLTIALPPTDEAAGPGGRPGAWSLTVRGAGPFDAQVQRDDAVPGFGGGARQVRLVDDVWRSVDERGRAIHFDGPEDGPVLREGTVNAWATAGAPWQLAASAAYPARGEGPPWAGAGPGAGAASPGDLAPYSALPAGVRAADHLALAEGARAVADLSPCTRGVPASGAFAGARLRVSGTSVAAPQVARALADALARGESPTAPICPPAPSERPAY